ncbi:MAG: dUTP diphosphatase [Candidatus Marinimicrobia bacterium]|nr:dUTP diphosphatase [Candidatus Neomarinimicrobiota bacterium]
MKLLVKAHSLEVKTLYEDHGHFHDGDAGLDLFVIFLQTIEAGETAFLHLQISCENLDNKPYLLMPRSSISKTPLRLSNSIGLIDAGYRGEIIAAVDNIKDDPYTVEAGQRLFQLVAMDGSPVHYKLVDKLSDTSRGAGGFGSTGA